MPETNRQTLPNSQELPLYQRVYKMVKQIPAGKVATYGQIARLVGGCTARMVGYALSALRDETSRSAKRGSETHFQPKGRSGDAVRR